jgi:hypothetical protein
VNAETIALASIIVSGVVGVGGLAAGLFGAWLDRVHNRNVQREARQQERVEETYEQLIVYVEKQIRIAARLRPLISHTNDPPPPDITQEEADRVQALVDLYASSEVEQLTDDFSAAQRKIDDAEQALKNKDMAAQLHSSDLDATDFGWPDWPSAYMFVSHEGVTRLREIKHQMRQQMRRELNPGPSTPALGAPRRKDDNAPASWGAVPPV